jgi:hypothetical protein
MAHSPKPGGGRRSAVKPPNEAGPGGNRANNSFLPLAGSASPHPPGGLGGDRRNGSFPLGEIASPVHLPENRFDVETAKMPQPPSAIEPGRGAIPVNPWDAAGRPNQAVPNPVIPREPGR